MRTILVTGATGFVGRHLIQSIRSADYRIIALGRSIQFMDRCPWLDGTTKLECDPLTETLDDLPSFTGPAPDWLVHLAWGDVGNNHSLDHFEKSMTGSWRFIRSCVGAGIRNVMVSGTCLEYGMQSGGLSANLPPNPVTAYGIAKDGLRRQLQYLQRQTPFQLVWGRIFYMWGEGQNPRSLIPSLNLAVRQRQASFLMSGGEQERDFIPAAEGGRQLADLLNSEHPGATLLANVCSGHPTKIKTFVENYLQHSDWRPKLDFGAIPYSTSEPMSFWGIPEAQLAQS
ncbi:MAG: NAD-dependent epimerase/dehydratase family protein [Pseudomonadota bacterium]